MFSKTFLFVQRLPADGRFLPNLEVYKSLLLFKIFYNFPIIPQKFPQDYNRLIKFDDRDISWRGSNCHGDILSAHVL